MKTLVDVRTNQRAIIKPKDGGEPEVVRTTELVLLMAGQEYSMSSKGELRSKHVLETCRLEVTKEGALLLIRALAQVAEIELRTEQAEVPRG